MGETRIHILAEVILFRHIKTSLIKNKKLQNRMYIEMIGFMLEKVDFREIIITKSRKNTQIPAKNLL
jgi:hypothetical protein